MTTMIGSATARFAFESHDHAGNFTAALPYRNAQGEFMLNATGSQMRCEIPYRGFSQITQANLFAGKHELWVYDRKVSTISPIFQGPIWDITADSSAGVLAVSAQDPLSYYAKKVLRTNKTYSALPEAAMSNLISYVGLANVPASITSISTASNGATNISLRYRSYDRIVIADALNDISQMGDGVDYYIRGGVFYLYGGKIRPTAKSYALEYGGALNQHSVQWNAQTLVNDYELLSNNGRLGAASNTSKQTEYGVVYQAVDSGSDLTSTTALNGAASTYLKANKSTKVIPTIVTATKTPVLDFDFGDQFQIVINDGYVQVNKTIRVIGWQLTIGQGDNITTVIYTNDTETLV